MKTAASLLSVALVFSSIACAAPPKGSVAGTVIDAESGAPVANVNVQLLQEYTKRAIPVGDLSPTLEAKTDAGGRFVIKQIPEGHWRIGVRDTVMAPASDDEEIEIESKKKVKDIELKVVQGASLEGGVYTDEDFEKGVPGLVIEAECLLKEPPRVFQTRTDAQGKFRLGGLPVDYFNLKPAPQQPYVICSPVFVDDKAVDQCGLRLKPKQQLTMVEFQVKPSYKISGQVLGTDGNPVPNAEVGEFWSDSYDTSYFQALVQTDATGRFAILSLPEKEGYLTARNDKLLSKKTHYVAVSAGEQEEGSPCILKLLKPSRIRGQVVDKNGNPMPKASLHLETELEGGGSTSREIEVDAQARFDKADLFGGTYCFQLYDFDHAYGFESFESKPFDLQDEQFLDDYKIAVGVVTKTKEEMKQEGLTISGKVMGFDGKPLSGASVGCYQRMNQKVDVTETSADGKYAIHTPFTDSNKNVGALTLAFAAIGYQREFISEIQPGSTNIDVTLKAVPTLKAKVVSDATGNPVTEFTVKAKDIAAGAFSGLVTTEKFEEKVTNPDGRFSVQLPPSPWEFTISAPGYLEERQHIDIPANKDEFEIEFRMKQPAALHGEVRNAAGQPIEKARITIVPAPQADIQGVWPLGRSDGSHIVLDTDASGQFSVTDLAAGAMVLKFQHPYYSRKEQAVTLQPGNDNHVAITLEGRGVVSGHVTMNGQPLAGVFIGSGFSGRSEAQTDEHGAYRLEDLDLGEVKVAAQWKDAALPQTRYRFRTVQVFSDKPATADLDFAPATSGLSGVCKLDGNPTLAHVFVRFYCGPGEPEKFYLMTLSDGTYAFSHMPYGRAVIQFRAGNRAVSKTVTFPKDGVLNLDADIGPGVTVSGSVPSALKDDGLSVWIVAGTWKAADFLDDPLSVLDARVVASCRVEAGAFSFENIPPGTYTIVVAKRNAPGRPDTREVLLTKTIEVSSQPVQGVTFESPPLP